MSLPHGEGNWASQIDSEGVNHFQSRDQSKISETASRDVELVTGTLHQLTLLDPRAGMYLMSSTITATARVFVFLSAR